MKFKVVPKTTMQPDKRPKEESRPSTDEQDRLALASNNQVDAQQVTAAHDAADKDMEADAELTATSPNDDLDEGETARLGEDLSNII